MRSALRRPVRHVCDLTCRACLPSSVLRCAVRLCKTVRLVPCLCLSSPGLRCLYHALPLPSVLLCGAMRLCKTVCFCAMPLPEFSWSALLVPCAPLCICPALRCHAAMHDLFALCHALGPRPHPTPKTGVSQHQPPNRCVSTPTPRSVFLNTTIQHMERTHRRCTHSGARVLVQSAQRRCATRMTCLVVAHGSHAAHVLPDMHLPRTLLRAERSTTYMLYITPHMLCLRTRHCRNNTLLLHKQPCFAPAAEHGALCKRLAGALPRAAAGTQYPAAANAHAGTPQHAARSRARRCRRCC